jgi:flagellar basal-body rod protein FlgB
MSISDLPILSMLRTRMEWHQERQRVLAENVANADTPKYQARDLVPPKFDAAAPEVASLTLARTSPGHLGGSNGADAAFDTDRKGNNYEVRPAGNAVNLEEQMMKVAANQMDYQAVTALYGRSLALIKMAIGRA